MIGDQRIYLCPPPPPHTHTHSQFCDFNKDPRDVSKVINDLDTVGENYKSFGK